MTPREPESLEETQRRLAGVSPYGPAAAERPDPYSPGAAPLLAATPRPRNSARVFAIVGGAIAVTSIAAGFVYFQADPTPTPEAPIVDEWTTYPGSAFFPDRDVLAAESLEVISGKGDAFVAEFKQQLTDELGLEWTELMPRSVEADINGYGGDSMLKYYHSGSWQGAVAAEDPGARQVVQDAFERLSVKFGATDFYVANDFVEGDDAVADYGAAERDDQPRWSFWSDDPYTLGMNGDVLDLSLPAANGYEYYGLITVEPGDPHTFFVSVYAMAYALLPEADRDAYIEALAEYEGLTKPEPRY
jgi:hypothetical protein